MSLVDQRSLHLPKII